MILRFSVQIRKVAYAKVASLDLMDSVKLVDKTHSRILSKQIVYANQVMKKCLIDFALEHYFAKVLRL